MTVALNGQDIVAKITEQFPDSIIFSDDTTVIVKSYTLHKVAEFLKNTPEYNFDYLADLTSADYLDYFEVIYHLVSLEHNHSLTLKTRCYDRDNAVVPTVYDLWQAADYQEREVYDLMGIQFEGHPNLRRLFLWEGFPGHPQRRDYL